MSFPLRRRVWLTFAGFGALAVAACVVAPLVGTTPVSLGRAFDRSIPFEANVDAQILFVARLPRTLAGAIVGAALAAAGVVLQALLRTPLASPFTLGVSAGAALGAMLAITFIPPLGLAGLPGVTVASFAGALGAVAVVYLLAGVRHRGLSTDVLLLAGVTLNAFLSPGICYANWFSYKTADFISQNREIQRAIRTTRWEFPELRIRFVMDSGADNQKVFGWMDQPHCEFVIVASHLERLVEVYNDRLDRWETEHLQDLVDSVPWMTTYQAVFHHAGKTRLATIQAGWFLIRLPNTHQPIWVLVAHNTLGNRHAVLLTNVPIHSETDAIQLYGDWRLRGKIEHGYRFDQEQGLDVEDLRVQTLERMRRLFALVLAAAQFVFHMTH